MSSPEIGAFAENGGMALIPVGACEEHSRHLPVITDTLIAAEAAYNAAREVSGDVPVSVLPPIWFGYTVRALKKWPGTVTVRPTVLIDMLYDICESLIEMGIRRILIVNGHGNNPGALDVAVRSIGDNYGVFPGIVNTYGCLDADVVEKNRKSSHGGISHAGEAETSLMLYLSEMVDMNEAESTDMMKNDVETCPVDTFCGRKKMLFLSTWFLENSKNGACGDPSAATREFGEILFKNMLKNLSRVINDFYLAQSDSSDR